MLIFDIRPPIRKHIKAVSEATAHYYNWLKLFIKTSEYGLAIIITVAVSVVIIPIITFATISHTNTVKFTPTIVNIDPIGEAGWQNIGNIQNIDLSNQAHLSEFNQINSVSLNAPFIPPVTAPVRSESQPPGNLPANEAGESGLPATPSGEPNEPGPPTSETGLPTQVDLPVQAGPSGEQPVSPPASPQGEINLPGPAGNKDELPPVIEEPKPKPAPPVQSKIKSKPSARLNNNNLFASLGQAIAGLTGLAQIDEGILPTEEAPAIPDANPTIPEAVPSVEEPAAQPEVILPSVDGEPSAPVAEQPQKQVSIFTIRKNMVISDFKPEKERDAASVVKAVRLNLSMGITGRLSEDDELLIGYKVGDAGVWNQLTSFTQDQDHSNFSNSDYFSYELPANADLSQLKIEIFSLSNNDRSASNYEPLPIYIDAAWVEVDYRDEVAEPDVIEKLTDQEEFTPSDEPQFEFELDNTNRNSLDKLISVILQNRNFKVDKIELIGAHEDVTEITDSVKYRPDGKWTVKIPKSKNQFIPGKYLLKIYGQEDGQQYIEEQTFYWGVLAINVNKSIYLPAERAHIQMAALSDTGRTICDANLFLEITSPNGVTANPTVQKSGQCSRDADIVDVPDYFAYYQTSDVGAYKMKLTWIGENKKKLHQTFSTFETQASVPFEVERVGPTRIYPLAKYKMEITVKANQDFSGNIVESVPSNFMLAEDGSFTKEPRDFDTLISWLVDLRQGDTTKLSYEFDAPDISPVLYLLGPVTVGEWQETRFWQVAADAIPGYRASGTFTAGTGAITPPYPASMVANDVCLLVVTSENQANSLTTANGFVEIPTWSPQSAGTAATDPGSRLSVYWKRTVGGDSAPVVADSINNTEGQIHCFSGVITSGDPWDTGAGGNDSGANDTTGNIPGSTTTVADTLVVIISSTSFNGTSTAEFSGWTNADLANILERADNSNTAGLGGGHGMATGEKAIAGAYTTTAVTLANTSYKGAISLALKPPVPSPILDQNHYRWRDDTTALNTDGGYLAAADTLYTPLRKNTTVRLRAEIANTGTAAATSYNYRLESALLNGTCAASTFAAVPVTATTEAWEMVATANYADADAITASRLTATGTFVNGVAVEDPSNQTAAFSLTNGNYTEFEYAIQATSNAIAESTYCFRLTNASSTTNFTYSVYPQITLDVDGGRMFSSGFELQSVTADMEWTTVNGTPVINTATKRGGGASLEISSLASTTQKITDYQFKAANANGPFFGRAYIKVSTAPSAENRIISFRDSGAVDRAYITLDSGRLLRLYDATGVIGSASSALTLDTWYRIELKIDASGTGATDTVEAKIDGTNFATSSTRTLANGPNQFVIGGNLAGEAQTAGAWYFDDVAVNENVGSSNNSYPGAGSIVHLAPNADGDTVACTGGFADADETTPDDDTTYIGCANAGDIEEVNVTDPGNVGLRSTDTITLVSVGDRFRTTSGGTFSARIKSTSASTIASSATITPGTAYTTNAAAAPRLYPITSYSRPEGGTWTPAYLATTQIGVNTIGEPGAGTNNIRHTTLWLLVEYVPAANPPLSQTQYDSTHDTVIATGGTTADGVTNNIYLDFDAISSFLSEILTPKVEVRDTGTSLSNVATNTGATSVVYDAQFPDDIRSTCIVKDTLNNQLVMWGGQTGATTKVTTNNTWVMSLQPGYRSQWKLLTTSGTLPQVNRAHVCVYDSLNDRLVVFGGWTGSVYLNVPWFLSLPASGTPTWTQPTVTNSPPSATGQLQAVAVYDPSPSRMIVYGGYFSTDTDIDAVYELTLPATGNPTWNNLGLTTGPSAATAGRDCASMVYDDDSDRAVLYGGHINANTAEVWSLNLAAGSEAWTQITPTGSPGTKCGHMAGFQPDYTSTDDRMITYGGTVTTSIAASVADVWELTLPESGTSIWTDKSPAINQRPFATSLGGLNGIYDANGPNGPRMLFVPGYDGTNFDNGRVLAIDLPATGSFEYKNIVDIRRYVTARDQVGMIYDAVNKDIIAYGGACCGDGPAYAYHVSDTQKLRVTDSTPAWRDAGSDMAPIVREAASMVYDTTSGSERAIMCFGLSSITPNYTNDCWQLSLPTSGRSKWTNLSPSGTLPGDRWAAAAAYDDLNDRMVVFGGTGGAGSSKKNDLNFLSLGTTPAWTVPTVTGTPPSARSFVRAIYDPARDRMILFGGETDTAVLNEVWELTLPATGNPTWTQLSPTGTAPSARTKHSAIYDPDRGDGVARMVVFGGADGAATPVQNNEVWELTLPATGDGVWTQLSPTGTAPSARRSMGLVYDTQNDRMIVLGGRDANTTRFFDETFALSLGASPAWSNLNPDKTVPLTVAVSSLVAGTNYHWQSWFTGASSNNSTMASYGGNSDVVTAATDFGILSSNITVSGNVYNYTGEGTTALTDCDGSTLNVALRAGTTTYTTTCDNATGAFSFSNVTKPSAGAGMVVWIDHAGTTTQNGALVIRYDGAGSSIGNVFWENTATVTSDDTSAVTNTNMDTYDNVNDADIPYTVTGTALTVNNGIELHITTAKTFTPGGTVTTDPSASASTNDGDVHIAGTGTLNMEANALSVGGDFNNAGTMTFTSGQTTTFTATATGHVITDGGENFENIIFNGLSGGWSFADATIINQDLTSTAGTLSGTVDITVTGNVACGVTCGAITLTGGTFLQSVGASAKNFGTNVAVATNWQFFNLTFTSNASVVITTSSTGTGTIEVTNALTISASSTLNAGNRTYILSGAIAAPFVKTGTFQYSTGTMKFTGNSASVVVNALSGSAGSDGYYNLELKPSGAVTYALAAGTYQVNNNLDIGDGAIAGTVSGTLNDPTINVGGNLTINASATLIAPDAAGNILSVKGNWLNSGTFTNSSQTVQFNGTATGKTINTGGTGAGKDFYNVTFNGSGGAWSPLTSQMTITNDLTMTAGTLDNSSGSADIVVNGAVAGTAGIINLTTNTFEQRVVAAKNFGTTSGTTAWTFFNLTFSNSNSTATAVTVTTQTGGSGGITVGSASGGVLNIGKTLDATGATTTLDAGNRTWTLAGTAGDPFQILASPAGNLTPATSTFLYTGNNGAGNTTVQSETYNVLEVNNASEIYALETGGATGATVTITAGALDTGANALSATGDLTVTGTLQGTGNVTVNGNVTGTGTITMTGGTFEQIISGANKNFGASSGTNPWTFSGLKFNNSDGALARTITPNAGTGTVTVSGILTLGDSGTQNITFDNETSNDRVFDINGDITISTKGAFSASSTAAFTLAGNFTDNKTTSGGFTPNSGTVTIDGAGTSTFDGANTPAITFFNLTSTTAGKILAFTASKTFKINTSGKLTITGASGNQIHIHSTSGVTQWLIDHQGTEDVTYAHIEDSGCAGTTTNVSLNSTSTAGDSNNGNCWLFPSLTFSLNTTSIGLDLTAGNSWTTTATNTLTVTTTATSGYSLSAYETGLLTHTGYAGVTIANYTDAGTATYLNPTAWTVTCGADVNKCGFGYNTNDADVTQFGADKYAPFSQTAPGDEVAKSTSPQFTNDITTITYRSSVSATQKAGPYTTTIIYIVTPQF